MKPLFKKIAIYFLLGFLTFAGIVIAFAPAALLWRQVDTQVLASVPDLKVSYVKGTLWQGQSELYYRTFPGSRLNWNIAPLPALLQQAIDADLILGGEGHELQAAIVAASKKLIIESGVGYVDASYINRVSQPQGLTFVGRVDIKQLELTSDLRWVQQVSGEVYWPGGKIVSRTAAAGTRVFDLPALIGQIQMRGENINLILHPQNPDHVLVDILVKPSGWVAVAVKARLFDLAGLPWPAGSSLSDTVLEFEEQLLRGAR